MLGGEQHGQLGRVVAEGRAGLRHGPGRRRGGIRGQDEGSARLHWARLHWARLHWARLHWACLHPLPAFTRSGYPAAFGWGLGRRRLAPGKMQSMRYMLMFWVDESGEVTADEDAAMMIAVKSWVEETTERGVLVHGGALRAAREAKIVRVSDGELLVSDGPFAETKEQIGGYVVVEGADLDAAVRIAAAHPLARTARVEVRPFWDAPWDQ